MVEVKKTVEAGKRFITTSIASFKNRLDRYRAPAVQPASRMPQEDGKKQDTLTLQEARQVFQERVSSVEPSPKQQFQRLVESSAQKESKPLSQPSGVSKSSGGVSRPPTERSVQEPAPKEEVKKPEVPATGTSTSTGTAISTGFLSGSRQNVPVVVSDSIPKQMFQQAFQGPSLSGPSPARFESTFSKSTPVAPASIAKEEERFFKRQFEDVVQEAHKQEQVKLGKELWQDRMSGGKSEPRKEFEEHSKRFQVKAPKVEVDEFSDTPKATFSKYSQYIVKPETIEFSPVKVNIQEKEYFALDASKHTLADLTWYAKKIGYEGKIYSFEGKYLLDVPNAPSLTTKRAVVQDFLLGGIEGTPIKSDEGVYVYDVSEKSGYFFSVPKENYDALVDALLESGKVTPKYSSSYGDSILEKLKEKGETVVRFVSRQPAGFEASKDFKIVDAGDSIYVYTSDPNFRQYLNVAEFRKMQEQALKYQVGKLYASEGELDRTLRGLTKTIAPVQLIKAGVMSGEQGIPFEQALSKVAKEEAFKGYEDYLRWAMGSRSFGSTASFLWKQGGVRVPIEYGASWALGSVMALSKARFLMDARFLPLAAGTGLAFSWTPSVVQSIKGEKPWSETSQVISESVFDIEAMRSGLSSGFNVGSRIKFLLDERKLQPVVMIDKGKAFVGTKIPLSYKDLGSASLGRVREGSVELLYKVTPDAKVVANYPGRDMLLAPVTRYGVSVYPFSYNDFILRKFKSDIGYIAKGVREPWKNVYIAGTDMTLKRTPEIKNEGLVSFGKSEMLDVRKVLKEDVFFKEFFRGWTRTGVAEAGYKYSLKPVDSKNLERILFVSGAGVKEYPFGKIGVVDEPLQSPVAWRLIENVQKTKVLSKLSSNLRKVSRGGDFEWRLKDSLFKSLYKKYPEYFYRETEGVFPYTKARQFMYESGGKPAAESYLVAQRFVEKEPSPFFEVAKPAPKAKSFSRLVKEIYGKEKITDTQQFSVKGKETAGSFKEGSVKAASEVKPFVASMPAEGVVSEKALRSVLPVFKLEPEKTEPFVEPSSKIEAYPLQRFEPFLKPESGLALEPKMETVPETRMEASLETRMETVPEPRVETVPEPRMEAALEPRFELVMEPALEIEPRFGLEPKSELFAQVPAVPPIALGRVGAGTERGKKRKKEEYVALEETKAKAPKTYLFPDLYSVMVSQAAFGKATVPEFGLEEKSKLYKKGLIRVPTKEYKGIGSSKEVWKKIIG